MSLPTSARSTPCEPAYSPLLEASRQPSDLPAVVVFVVLAALVFTWAILKLRTGERPPEPASRPAGALIVVTR